MSIIEDAWESLRTVTALIDKLEGYNESVKALRADVHGMRERLVRVETIIDFARGQVPQLPAGG